MEIIIEKAKPQYRIKLENNLIAKGQKIIDSVKLEEWKNFLRERDSYTLTAMPTALKVIETLNKGGSTEEADDIIGNATGFIDSVIAATVVEFCERGKEFGLYYKNKYNISHLKRY